MSNSELSIRTDNYQTSKSVTLSLFKGGKNVEIVDKIVDERSLELRIKIDGKEETAKWVFYGKLKPDTVVVEDGKKKIEVIITKAGVMDWPSVLEPVEGGEKKIALYEKWGQFKMNDKADDGEEDDEKKADLNDFLKQIYNGGTDEQKRAMMKSITESKGTVLSTNWSEVGDKFVEPQPPK